jgi:hypothetical protein
LDVAASVTDDCDHREIELSADSAPDDPDLTTAPYGPIIQRGRCRACHTTVKRRLRLDNWGPWQADQNEP